MNLKISDLVKFNNNSQRIFSEKMPLACAYKLSKIQRAAAEDIDFYQKRFFEIINEYGKRKENGELEYTEDGTVVLMQEDKTKEAQEKISELNNMEVHLDIEDYLLELSDFDKDKKMSMEDISGILPFIK